MKRHKALVRLLAIFVILFILSSPSSAKVYTIQFSGIYGYSYFPDSVNVFIGDTIKFVGDFKTFPLQSTSVPAGAAKFGPIDTGTTFLYPTSVLGTYNFQNNIYAPIGMKGNFKVFRQIKGGITNEGREFYLGMLTPSYNSVVVPSLFSHFAIYALISSYYDNKITMSYFDQTGKETSTQSFSILAGYTKRVTLNTNLMQMDTASDAASYKSCHITSKYPVTIYYQSIGACAGGSYLALPVLGLGKNYVAASYNDNPGNGALTQFNPKIDYAGGEFQIIATENGTNIKITPTTTTVTGHPGLSNGIPHPYNTLLNKGQCYLVRSNGRDENNDLSGSLIEASAPIVVISGHENASLGGSDPYEMESRDFMIEQMVPVEYWDSMGYVSIPMAEANPPGQEGHGDTYRIYCFDNSIVKTHLDVQGINGGYDFSTTRLVSPPEKLEVTGPAEAYALNGKKISLMQYDEKSITINSPWPAPSMITVVPVSRWKTSYFFSVFYDINQFSNSNIYLNVLSTNLSKISVSKNGTPPTSLSNFSGIGGFSGISNNFPALKASQFRFGAKGVADSYFLYSNEPFMVYFYGIQDFNSNGGGLGQIKDESSENYIDEYAAPAGMQLNTGVDPSFKIDTISTCSGWHICVRDTGVNDPGLKAVTLIDDPDGVYYPFGGKYSNVSFDITSSDYTDGELHPHVHSNDPYCFDVNFTSALSAASAPLAIVDNLGNAIILRLDRTAPAIQLTTKPQTLSRADSIVFPVKKIGEQICTTFVFKNTAPKNGTALNLSSALLTNNDTSYKVVSVTPSLPHALAAQDSLMVQVCYTPQDSSRHRDSLIMRTDCFSIAISLDAHGSTGLISASDLDFGSVTAGDTLCKNLQIKNVGSAPFTLTKSFILSDNINFSVDSSKLPIVIQPNGSVQINICFHPIAEGSYSGGIDWSTDLEASFAHSVKSHSVLSGSGTPKASVKDGSAESFSIRPNPAHDRIIVSLGSGSDGLRVRPTEERTIKLFDVLGREVYKTDILSGLSQIEIPVRGLSEGVYFVQVGSVTQRVVVSH